jgi:ABC-type polysaccharide/polyol phosphate transport system ATPase subunit
LGIIGPNGAGKTTILRILARITAATRGRVRTQGRIGALINLGAGFHRELTGRENIYLNGVILGMSRREVAARFDEIVAFSGLEEFLDAPVKKYSAGMFARLGYSVAAHVDPDVLLVDEVLAVGDMSFQEKCMRHMDLMRKTGKTVVLVTHSLYRIEALCDQALWLDHGEVQCIGNAVDVVRAYLDSREEESVASSIEVPEGEQTDPIVPVVIERVELLDAEGKVSDEFPFGAGMTVRIHYIARQRIERPLFNLSFLHDNHVLLDAGMLIDGYGPEWIEGSGIVECHFDNLPLTPKMYEVLLFARNSEGLVDIIHMDTYARFRVTDEGLEAVTLGGPMALSLLRQGGPLYVPRVWRFYNSSGLTHTIEAGHDEHE